MNKTVVVLAAGMGSRYGGLKQMTPVGPSGEFLLDYAVYDAVKAGFSRVVFVIRKDMAEQFDATVGGRINSVLPVEYAFQSVMQVPDGVFVPATRQKPWGTGHALLAAMSVVHSPFCVINADDYYGPSAFDITSRFFDDTADDPNLYGMVAYRLMETLPAAGHVSRGICQVSKDGFLDRVIERTRVSRSDGQVMVAHHEGSPTFLSGNEMCSMNMWAFKPALFEFLDKWFREFMDKNCMSKDAEYYLVDVIDRLIREKLARVKVSSSKDAWFGVTNPEDLQIVQQKIGYLIDQGIYPSRLWS